MPTRDALTPTQPITLLVQPWTMVRVSGALPIWMEMELSNSPTSSTSWGYMDPHANKSGKLMNRDLSD